MIIDYQLLITSNTSPETEKYARKEIELHKKLFSSSLATSSLEKAKQLASE
jgi:hypothetical protein